MTAASVERSGRADPVFLVERYVTLASAAALPASVARTAQLCEASGALSAATPAVHYLNSTYMPTEDTCFCLFRAATAEAVQALNDQAGFAVDRITAAVLLHPVL